MKLLHAYVDGELDPTTSLALEAELAANPSLRAAHERLRELSSAIRDGADYYRAPDSLRARLGGSLPAKEASPPLRAHRLRWLAPAAALASVAAIAFAVAVILVRPAEDERLLQDILASHARATLGQRLMDVPSSEQHTVKPWLSERLPFSPPVADYSAQGYALAGARVDYAGGRPVAVLVYKRRKHSIEVFVAPGSGSAARAYSRDGFNVQAFAHAGMSYWLVSDVGRDELAEFAELLRRS